MEQAKQPDIKQLLDLNAKGSELKKSKISKKAKQQLADTQEDQMKMFQESENDNKKMFVMIDSMHLQKLTEFFNGSQKTLESVLSNLTDKEKYLKNLSKDLAQSLHVDMEKVEQSESKKSELESQPEVEFLISEMVSETPSEQPRLHKKLQHLQDMNLAKMKEFLTNQQNILNSLTNSIREIVSKINPYEIGNLNIKGKQPLEDLFTLLFELLYHETPYKLTRVISFLYSILVIGINSFGKHLRQQRYSKKKDQLIFCLGWRISKLSKEFQKENKHSALPLYREVSMELLEKIAKLKDSEELRGYLEDPKVGEALIDIADWLEFVYHGNSLANELATMEDLFIQAKETVETLERNERKEQYIKNVQLQRLTEEQNNQEFVGFITEKLEQMKNNYSRCQQKLSNHIQYQSELLEHIVLQEKLKNSGENSFLDIDENIQNEIVHLNKTANPSSKF